MAGTPDTLEADGLAEPAGAVAAAMKITVAPTGARRGKADHPNLPITIEEIAAEAARSHAAGAAEIHLHVRDSLGRHCLDPGRYRAACAAIGAEAPGMSVQITTEAAGRFEVADQYALLRALVPGRASVSVREMARDPELAAKLYGFTAEAGIRLQHILYDTGDLAVLRSWRAAGVVPADQREVILVLGRYSPPLDARPADLAPFVAALAGAFPAWTVCAFGGAEHLVACAACAMGGHVRVGFENNILRPDGTRAESSAENVARIATAARAMGRPVLH